MNALIDNLTQAGKRTMPLDFSDGTRLVVLPDSGRLLGLYPPDGDANFLWTNPALDTVASAQMYFARSDWPNLGGDRTWLAPEINLFIGDPRRPSETYAVPSALDPGNWTLASAGTGEVNLINATRVRSGRSKREVGVRLGRRFSAAANPLRDTSPAGRELQYAGYTLNTTLELESVADHTLRLGIWNLLQLPQPGEMLISTLFESRPQLVFGSVSAEELTVAPRVVLWRMGGSGSDAKIGLKAASLTGRAGYLRQTAEPGICDLVVREFAVDPVGDYVDALWDNPEDTGWVFQACCIRNGVERFDELEYHAPAAATIFGSSVSRDESRVWAYRGPGSAVTAAAHLLLGLNG